MANKKRDMNLDDILEKFYWILKTKLHFDDIQTATTMASIILLPISIYLGLINGDILFKRMFYITLALDALAIIYSFVKNKYFNDIRAKEEQASIELKIKDIHAIDTLSGYDFEKFAAEYYKLLGYETELTQGSHDNGADLIARKDNTMLCVEAKRRSKKINRHVVLSVHYAMEHVYRGDRAIIFTNTELTDQARAAAKDKDVEYIDRYAIEKFLRKHSNIIINKID